MDQKAQEFKLSFLLNPVYMTARLGSIKSCADLLSRSRDLMRYAGFGLRGVRIRTGIRIHNGYYHVRGLLIRAGTACTRLRIRRVRVSENPAARGAYSAPGKTQGRLQNYIWWFLDACRDAKLAAAVKNFKPRRKAEPAPNPPSSVNQGGRGFRFSWNLYASCNYACPYCWFQGRLGEYRAKAPVICPEKWISRWNHLNDLYGPAYIVLSGGEPFLYPGLVGMLAALARRNTFLVITNLHWDPALLKNRLEASRVSFSCSFHPSSAASPELFAEKIVRLRGMGFHAEANITAWPPYLTHIPDWMDVFSCRGISVLVQPFFGWRGGRRYPAAYTAQTRNFLSWFINGEYLKRYPAEVVSAVKNGDSLLDSGYPAVQTAYQLRLLNTHGRLCHAGKDYGRIEFDGTMNRCAQGGYVGDFMSDDFRMTPEAKPCPFHFCESANEAAWGPRGYATP